MERIKRYKYTLHNGDIYNMDVNDVRCTIYGHNLVDALESIGYNLIRTVYVPDFSLPFIERRRTIYMHSPNGPYEGPYGALVTVLSAYND